MKLRKTFNGNLKAVSPVIATIIIVAIAIVMSIAVAYWMLGLGGSFTKFEKVEFTAAYVTGDEATGFIVHMDLKNTGSAAATIDPAYIAYNGKPDTAYAAGSIVPPGASITLDPGQEQLNWQIGLDSTVVNSPWVSGMTVEIMLHTTAGKDYPKVITLP